MSVSLTVEYNKLIIPIVELTYLLTYLQQCYEKIGLNTGLFDVIPIPGL